MQKLTFHIAPGYLPGDMRIYHRMCKALQRAGYRVCLAATGEMDGPLEPGMEVRSLGEWSLGAAGWSVSQRWPRCRQVNRMARLARADLYAFYSLEFVPWAISLRHRTGKPVVFDCMEDFESYALLRPGIPKALRRPLAWVVGSSLRYVARRIDAMVFADQGTARRFEGYARRTLVVHNFPDLDCFPKPEAAAGDKPFDLTFHGTFHEHILRACLEIDEALVARKRCLKWCLIGHLPLREWFVSELTKRKAQARFHLVGLLPHDQVASEVCKAKIGIIPLPNWPKYQNNLPQKQFEFMALEMPVVLSDLPPSRPFMGDSRCGLMVRPDDPGAYAEAIIRLMDDAALRQGMGREGRRRVEERWNWGREAARLIALYRELLGEPAAQSGLQPHNHAPEPGQTPTGSFVAHSP